MGLTILSSASLAGELVIFGGGSPRKPGDVMFQNSFAEFEKYADKNKTKWNTRVYDSWRNAYPDKATGKKTEDANAITFMKEFRNLSEKIKSGKITSGEQVMVILNTHGLYEEYGKYKLGTSQIIPEMVIKSFKQLQQVAEEKGVKLAIVGLTCGSGSLLEYSSDKTCVISSSRPNRVGVVYDGDSLSSAFNSPSVTNLEEAYLEARKNGVVFEDNTAYGYPTQPMISTKSGITTDELLSPLQDAMVTDQDFKSFASTPICRPFRGNLERLESNIPDINNSLKLELIGKKSENLTGENKDLYNRLKKDIDKYNELAGKLTKRNVKLNELKNRETCIEDADLKKCATVEEWKNLEREIKYCTASGTIPEFCKKFTSQEKLLQKYKKHPDFQAYNTGDENDRLGSGAALYKEMNEVAFKIATAERILYDQLYRKNSANDKSPNPCRDFKL
jgi:hypothetical protein